MCITGSDKFGLPTSKDEDVLLALVQLTKLANNFSSPEVQFTKHQVIELLGWENRGWAYERVEESLHRWKDVSVHYWNAWRDHSRETWRDSEAIGILEYVKLVDGRRRRRASGMSHAEGLSRFIWNQVLFESFRSGYLKKLDFRTYLSLRRPAARRAYRFLDKRFHHKDEWEFDLKGFACEKLGFSRSYDTGQLKDRLKPAFEELSVIGFIEMPFYRKESRGVWKLIVRKAHRIEEPKDAVTMAPDLKEALISRGISAKAASELVTNHPRESVQEKVDYFDSLVRRRDRRVSENPAGFLVSSIRCGYAVPSGGVRTNESVKARSSSRKRPQVSRSVLAESNDDGGATENLNEVSQLREHEDSLCPDEQIELEARAISEASAFEQQTCERLKTTNHTLWVQLRDRLVMACLQRHGVFPRQSSMPTGTEKRE